MAKSKGLHKMHCEFCNEDVLLDGHLIVHENCGGFIHRGSMASVCALCGKTIEEPKPEEPHPLDVLFSVESTGEVE